MRPRLVATDLDGTLVRSDGTVSAYTAEVLARVEEQGVPVVFVTGRPLRWAEEVFEHVGEHGLAVVSNGALVWDVPRHRAELERPIEPALGLEVCELLRAALPGTTYAVETLDGIDLEPEFLERYCSTARRSSCWRGTRSSRRRSSGTSPRRWSAGAWSSRGPRRARCWRSAPPG